MSLTLFERLPRLVVCGCFGRLSRPTVQNPSLPTWNPVLEAPLAADLDHIFQAAHSLVPSHETPSSGHRSGSSAEKRAEGSVCAPHCASFSREGVRLMCTPLPPCHTVTSAILAVQYMIMAPYILLARWSMSHPSLPQPFNPDNVLAHTVVLRSLLSHSFQSFFPSKCSPLHSLHLQVSSPWAQLVMCLRMIMNLVRSSACSIFLR